MGTSRTCSYLALTGVLKTYSMLRPDNGLIEGRRAVRVRQKYLRRYRQQPG